MNDPLDDLLAAPAARDDGAKLRQTILRRSTGVLRRRRRVKQAAWGLALAACYLAGMGTMRWFMPVPAPQIVEVTPPEPKPEAPVVPPSATALENLALDSTDRRAELYRAAAERYRAQGDLAAWVRCQDNALDATKKEDLAVSPDDDFLTIALKQDRQKQEKRDARKLD